MLPSAHVYSNFLLLLLLLLCQRFDGASTLCLIFALTLNLWAKEKSEVPFRWWRAGQPAVGDKSEFLNPSVSRLLFLLPALLFTNTSCSPGASVQCGQELGQHQIMLRRSSSLLSLSYSVVLPFGQYPDVRFLPVRHIHRVEYWHKVRAELFFFLINR